MRPVVRCFASKPKIALTCGHGEGLLKHLMFFKLLLVAVFIAPAAGWALPGEVVSAIAPRFDAPAPPAAACLDASGAIHLWPGGSSLNALETAALDGAETGGIFRLAADGTTAAILAPELVQWRKNPELIPFGSWLPLPSGFRCLADGRMMVCTPDQGGVLVSPAGVASSGFFKNLPVGIRLAPQFERGGYYYFVIAGADGTRSLVRQTTAASEWSPEPLPATGWRLPPSAAVPGPNNTIRVLGTTETSDSWGLNTVIQQRVFLIEETGQLVAGAPVYDPAVKRPANLSASPGSGYRLIFGVDPSRYNYWPAPSSSSYRVEWRDEANGLLRTMDFVTPLTSLTLVEGTGGELLATGFDGTLQRFSPDGVRDPSFTSPGWVSSALPLPDGKWLIDGTRRILANGTADPAWHRPNLTRPASFTQLLPTPDGGMLAVGDGYQAGTTTRLAKLAADGTPFPGFTADPRLGQIATMAAMPDCSVAVSLHSAIVLADGRRSKLVRLRPDGTLDESLFPPVDPPNVSFAGDSVATLLASQPDGKLLVVTAIHGGEVSYWTLSRLLPNLIADSAFSSSTGYGGWPTDMVVLNDGRIFVGSLLYSPTGQFLTNLDPAGNSSVFSPLCLLPDGAVMFSQWTAAGWQLRRWRNNGWDTTFAAAVDPRWYGLGASPGSGGKLYFWGSTTNATPPATQLVRLHRNGRLDASFRAPPLSRQVRRGPGPWQTFTPAGLVPFDPAANPASSTLKGVLWQPATDRVWLAGSFNMAGSFARDGLAVVAGESAIGYPAWSQAALRNLPAQAEPTMDPDGDGCSNFLEYATAADPLVANPADCALQPLAGEPLWFGLWKNPEAAEVYPVIKVCENLTHWRTATGSEITLEATGSQVIFGLFPNAPRRFAEVEFITP
jgi:WD40 repeat protein